MLQERSVPLVAALQERAVAPVWQGRLGLCIVQELCRIVAGAVQERRRSFAAASLERRRRVAETLWERPLALEAQFSCVEDGCRNILWHHKQ